jgi:hypothetical protein
VSTAGQWLHTTLAVYRGDNSLGLSLIVRMTMQVVQRHRWFALAAQAGETYRIAVDGAAVLPEISFSPSPTTIQRVTQQIDPPDQ